MKQRILLVLAMFLTLAGIQTAMAQTMTVHLANDEKVTYDVSQVDSVTFNNSGQQPQEDIIVTVDANGNADGGHHFDWIDNTNFYIDDVKYTAKDGNLVVTGYDPAFFQGDARLITRLIFIGRRMNVVEISEQAFCNCQVLKSVVIPKYVTSIGFAAFASCSGLTFVTIPESVTSIGISAFYGCTGLTSITIPESVTSIGDMAFYDCYFKKTDYTNNSTLSSSDNWGATLYDEETTDGLLIADGVVVKCRSWATSVTIPNSVTSIGDYAFMDCTGLTSITIGSSVTSIDRGAFRGCDNLTSVTVKAKTPPRIYEDTFYNVRNATLYVPTGCKATYQASDYWKSFKSIIEKSL